LVRSSRGVYDARGWMCPWRGLGDLRLGCGIRHSSFHDRGVQNLRARFQ
jgi:hypothetical protein